jgi:hypothetical protein
MEEWLPEAEERNHCGNAERTDARAFIPVAGGHMTMLIRKSQVAPLPVSLVSLAVVLTAPVRLLSVTCVGPVACSRPPRFGGSGMSRSTRTRSEYSGQHNLHSGLTRP